jgi:hypothetical protein
MSCARPEVHARALGVDSRVRGPWPRHQPGGHIGPTDRDVVDGTGRIILHFDDDSRALVCSLARPGPL